MSGLFVLLLACAASIAAASGEDYCPGIQCPAVVYRLYPSTVSECWYCVCYWGKLTPTKCDPGTGYDPTKLECTPNDNC
ncbi:hypothetical protein J437_LFUL007038 [Ladona fulva]|uniref:Chitin-binding type-2 domain-containing protein n=1 Tax=Ladona fulva TaxID=123851 RepID=A0A8K0NXQ4_LADFU|nr:hypothetical protein J437_LFUL007038 [Ladona fulva]